jgi:hypothetical protein
MKKLWIIGLLFLASNAFSQTTMTKVIELNYLQADKVIQLIQPLMQSGEKVSGSGQTLIVKVSPQTLTQIRDILHKIDVPPVTFNIEVYQGDPNWLSAQNSNSVSYSTQPPSEKLRSQSVQVMSGESAFISTGEEVPIITDVNGGYGGTGGGSSGGSSGTATGSTGTANGSTGTANGSNGAANGSKGASKGSKGAANGNTNAANGNYFGISYEQHNIKNGFNVWPVLKGSQVKLTIKRVREQVNAAGGQQFDNQQVNTTIMAPLNKWVSLGSAEGAQSNTDVSSTSNSAGRPFSQNSTLYIKVSVPNAMPAKQSNRDVPSF